MSQPSHAEHLRNRGLPADLARRSARSSAITMGTQAVRVSLMMGSTMVMSRLLGPDDFGVAALAMASLGMLSLVRDAGFGSAVVQQREVTQSQVSTLFWASVGIALAVAVAVFFLAPAFAGFYGDARVASVLRVLAIVPLVDSLGMQHQAVLSRQMRFGVISVLDASAGVVGLAVGIALAWHEMGFWSLVAQEVSSSVVLVAMLWAACGWRPGLPSRSAGVGRMVRFGLNLSGVRVLAYLVSNLDTMFVGRFQGAPAAGVYDRAFRLLTVSYHVLNQPIGAVASPTLSRLQDDPERFRTFFLGWVRFVVSLSMPLVAFLFVDARYAVIAVLGDRWSGIVPIYRVLAPAAFLGRLHFMNGWIYTATGRADRQLRWWSILLVPLAIGYWVGASRAGAMGVAAAHAGILCLFWYPGLVFCCRTAPVRPREVLAQIRMPAGCSIAAGAVLWLLIERVLPRLPITLGLCVHLVLFGLTYLAFWALLPSGRRNLGDLVRLARSGIGGVAGPPLAPAGAPPADSPVDAG